MANARELINAVNLDPSLLRELTTKNDAGKYDLLVSRGLLRRGEVMPSLTSAKAELASDIASPIADRLRDINANVGAALGRTIDLGGGRLTRPIDPAGKTVEWVGVVVSAAVGAASAACNAD
jgi:hypothetical protein